ncbi:hypothetical protein [Nocardia abscessus]|nr:hypothetical protein [Nocardia abscessus]
MNANAKGDADMTKLSWQEAYSSAAASTERQSCHAEARWVVA